ncbi:receptor/non-receptor type protein-tyrosine phosphatase [Gonapodya prolifera JEL478]|uniref:Receptor/non-receptor type protein-tyrosine phosphatase n=1 Tax=Gonapodya prolifera (strain JEL478) TaxID=1344416 RepID=A0A139ASW4_GONPJ|nr:receptor/non-receptor type protein-tyrosine phosphatase [Gonapodya prolifera JEL478]|eukprot:KXS19809.1 receptor/non-receptor type protein-tyrosine phosphatase [Gonapodya prolifera JEL478]
MAFIPRTSPPPNSPLSANAMSPSTSSPATLAAYLGYSYAFVDHESEARFEDRAGDPTHAQSTATGTEPRNRVRNRYPDVTPYECARVRLGTGRAPGRGWPPGSAPEYILPGSEAARKRRPSRPLSWFNGDAGKNGERGRPEAQSNDAGRKRMPSGKEDSSASTKFGTVSGPLGLIVTNTKSGGQSGWSDYINASYLTSYPYYIPPPQMSSSFPTLAHPALRGMPPSTTYIFTQGPTPATVGDFWQMVWEHGSRVVVMLTNLEERGRIKCHTYWPTKPGHTSRYTVTVPSASSPSGTTSPNLNLSQYTLWITLTSEERYGDDIIVRRLTMHAAAGEGQRAQGPVEGMDVVQIQLVGWPDHGVPEKPGPLLRIIQLANHFQTSLRSVGPMIVHCSAGVGRTGTFAVVDTMIKIAKEWRARCGVSVDLTWHGPLSQSSPADPVTGAPSAQNGRVLDVASAAEDSLTAASLAEELSHVPASLAVLDLAADPPGDDPVVNILRVLRGQRMYVVQTLEQFVYVYESLVEAIEGGWV